MVYLHFIAPDDNDLSGEWVTELDITEQAVVTAYAWLQDIEAVTVSLEDMGAHMPELTVQVNLVMEQSSQSEGTFSSNVLPESYAECEHAAYEAFAGAFRELLTERLRMDFLGSFSSKHSPSNISQHYAGIIMRPHLSCLGYHFLTGYLCKPILSHNIFHLVNRQKIMNTV